MMNQHCHICLKILSQPQRQKTHRKSRMFTDEHDRVSTPADAQNLGILHKPEKWFWHSCDMLKQEITFQLNIALGESVREMHPVRT